MTEVEQRGSREMELLQKKNIILNCKAKEKEEIIREIGRILLDSAYVEQDYIEGMIEREKSFPTNIGNGIAIPHGVEAVKKNIRNSGIAVMIFPEGTDWNGDVVKIVVGIAAKGEEHLDVLANIAEKLSTEQAVEDMVRSSAEEIYLHFTGK
ncbi:mannitol/fructose-specific phosphotransferase system IIA component [Anaerotaenia torta]|uniref:PTS sugar transporter subunit IIA n=1 Tax=Anaerotaenia torta TaxID=433293 RepID=UPI003D1B355F